MIAGSAISTRDDIHEDSNSKRTILDLNGEEAIHIEAESGRKRVRVDTLQLTGNIQAESDDLADGEIIYRKNEKKYDIGGGNQHLPVIQSNLETYYNDFFSNYHVITAVKFGSAIQWNNAQVYTYTIDIDQNNNATYAGQLILDVQASTAIIYDPAYLPIPITYPFVVNTENNEVEFIENPTYPYIAASFTQNPIDLTKLSRFAFQISEVVWNEVNASFNYAFQIGFTNELFAVNQPLSANINFNTFNSNRGILLNVPAFNWSLPSKLLYYTASENREVTQDPYVIPDTNDVDYEVNLPDFWNPDTRKDGTKGYAFAKNVHFKTNLSNALFDHANGDTFTLSRLILKTGQLEKVHVQWFKNDKTWRVYNTQVSSIFKYQVSQNYIQYYDDQLVSPSCDIPFDNTGGFSGAFIFDNPYNAWIGIMDPLGIDSDAKLHFKFDIINNQVYIGCESHLFQQGSGYNPNLETCNIPGKIYWNSPMSINYVEDNLREQYFFSNSAYPSIAPLSTSTTDNSLTSYKIKPLPIGPYLANEPLQVTSLDLSSTHLPLALPLLNEKDILDTDVKNGNGLLAFNRDKQQVQVFTSNVWNEIAFNSRIYSFPLIPVKDDDWYLNNNNPIVNTVDLTLNAVTKTFRRNSEPQNAGEDLIQTLYFEYRMNKLKFQPRQTFKIRPRNLMEYYVDLDISNQPLFNYTSSTWEKLDTNLGVQSSSLSSDWADVLHTESHNASLIRIRLPDCALLEEWEELNYTFILDIPDINATVKQFAEIEFYPYSSDLPSLVPKNRYTLHEGGQFYSYGDNTDNVFRTKFHYQNNGDQFKFTITKHIVYFESYSDATNGNGIFAKNSSNVLITTGH